MKLPADFHGPMKVRTHGGIRSREHWMIGDEYLYVLIGGNLHYVAIRNIASIEVRSRKPARSRPV